MPGLVRAAPLAIAASACSLFVGLDGLQAGSGPTAGSCDASSCVSAEGSTSLDGGNSDASATFTYNDVTDSTEWVEFDLAKLPLPDGGTPLSGYVGSAFDGRYLYLTPEIYNGNAGASSIVVRCDTTLNFASSAAWTTFDVSRVYPTAGNYAGQGFDGRYLYLAPQDGSIALRYDTRADFTTVASWESFDLSVLYAGAGVRVSEVIVAGNYAYFTPFYDAFPRFDLRHSFGDKASWEIVDEVNAAQGATYNYSGAVFDGQKFIYFPPDAVTAPMEELRLDTTGSFGSSTAWSKFNLATLDSGIPPIFNVSSVFDGRYVYQPPSGMGGQLLMRVDTQADFSTSAAFTSLDLATISGSFSYSTAAFDGRYVYIVPQNGGSLGRFDTRGQLADKNAWTAFGLDVLAAGGPSNFGGSVFDGHYLYLVPLAGGIVYRFDAREPKP